jgi:hypothetical protein
MAGAGHDAGLNRLLPQRALRRIEDELDRVDLRILDGRPQQGVEERLRRVHRQADVVPERVAAHRARKALVLGTEPARADQCHLGGPERFLHAFQHAFRMGHLFRGQLVVPGMAHEIDEQQRHQAEEDGHDDPIVQQVQMVQDDGRNRRQDAGDRIPFVADELFLPHGRSSLAMVGVEGAP